MIRSISPLLYNLGPSYLVDTLIMESTCQRGMCPLTLTSFSLFFDFAKFTSSFSDQVSFSISIKLWLSIFCPQLVMEGICQADMCHLTLTLFPWTSDYTKFTSSFHDQVDGFSITIYPRFTIYCPHVDYRGYLPIIYPYITLPEFQFHSNLFSEKMFTQSICRRQTRHRSVFTHICLYDFAI